MHLEIEKAPILEVTLEASRAWETFLPGQPFLPSQMPEQHIALLLQELAPHCQ